MGHLFQRPDLSGIRLFLFDWSGTVSDDRRPVFAANQRMRIDYGLPPVPSFEDWLTNCHGNAFDHFREAGVETTEAEVSRTYLLRLTEVVNEGTRPEAYGDARASMEALSRTNRPIGVVSSHPSSHLREEAERYGIDAYLAALRGDCREKAPELERLCAQFGVSPSEALYVGDTTYDIRAAKRAGLVSIGVTMGYHSGDQLSAEHPDALFFSLHEIVRAVAEN